MASTNIELYEALKKDVSEESARMVAEALTQAGDLATKADLAAAIAELKSYVDSRLLRYTAIILVPIALALLGSVGALIALVVNLK